MTIRLLTPDHHPLRCFLPKLLPQKVKLSRMCLLKCPLLKLQDPKLLQHDNAPV